jgi:hypothetical protein
VLEASLLFFSIFEMCASRADDVRWERVQCLMAMGQDALKERSHLLGIVGLADRLAA